MAMRGRTMRGGPSGRTDAEAGRVLTPITTSKALRQATSAAQPTRPGRAKFLSERLNLDFFRDAFAELRKVAWPTRQQAVNLTSLVIGVSIAIGVVLGAFDYVFEKVFSLFLS